MVDAIVNVSNWWNSVANAFGNGKYHIKLYIHTNWREGETSIRANLCVGKTR